MDQFPNFFWQPDASTGAENQQPNRQTQAPQINNPTYSTPGLNHFPNSVWQFDAFNGVGNQQARRQAQTLQAPQVNNPGYSMPGLFANVPGELPMAYGTTVPGTGMYLNSASSNVQASGRPEPDTAATNGPHVFSTAPELEDNGQQIVANTLAQTRHLSDEEFVRRYNIPESSDDQASGLPESDTLAINCLQVPDALTLGSFEEDLTFGKLEEEHFGPQVPAQVSSSELSRTRSSQEALKSQSSGSGPQTSGSGHYQPNHQAPNPGLPRFGDLQWGYEPSFFRPGLIDGNHTGGNEAYGMQLTFPQFSASQTPVASATSSDANNGFGQQALVHSGYPAFQSISSSGGPMGALQTTRRLDNAQPFASSSGQINNLQMTRRLENAHLLTPWGGQMGTLQATKRTPNTQRLVFARGPDLEIAQGQGMFENISQNSTSLVSVPESPRPPKSNKGQGDTPDPRYCMNCKKRLASFALRCDLCKQLSLYGLTVFRYCIFCRKIASGPTSIVCAAHERRMTTRLSNDEKKVLECEGICKRCYKADACPGILKCERCRSDQRRYGATSRESREQRGICLNCRNSVADSGFKNCEECRQKKADDCKLTRRRARDKGS